MRMTLLGPNQLWVADITYIRLACEFVYLAVVLDVFSRKVIGWALGRTLKAQLPICALERAIANRRPPPGVVHHSDQGVQYACSEYMQKLREHGMLPSMSRPSNPYDNATCESFLKTLKREEIHASTYRGFEDLRERMQDLLRGTTACVGYTRRSTTFARILRKRAPTRIPENVSGGDDDVLRRLMRASSRAMPLQRRV